jgi:predicted nucleotidyltransferase component of viral defense system
MDKVAALGDRERSQLFEETAARRSIHPAIIEKDFWVCWVLKKVFGCDELANHVIFKGGTSLSKVHGLIDRFSEDIDLVLNWELLGYGKGGKVSQEM